MCVYVVCVYVEYVCVCVYGRVFNMMLVTHHSLPLSRFSLCRCCRSYYFRRLRCLRFYALACKNSEEIAPIFSRHRFSSVVFVSEVIHLLLVVRCKVSPLTTSLDCGGIGYLDFEHFVAFIYQDITRV